jgi:hypothetical protein
MDLLFETPWGSNVTDLSDLQPQLDRAGPRLTAVEEAAGELRKSVEVGIDVSEVALLGRRLDATASDWVRSSSFLDDLGAVTGAFATCNGLAFSLAGHAKAAVGFSAMSHRSQWKSRWDNVWSEWDRALKWRDQVLAEHGLRVAHRVASDRADG